MMRSAILAAGLTVAALSGSAAAQIALPAGECAVIVAARPTLAEAGAYIRENGHGDRARIFAARNGWFSISIGTIANSGSTAQIEAMKRLGTVPHDAYCSTLDTYLNEVSLRAAADPVRDPEDVLLAPFDASPLAAAEKRLLQAALVLTGDYVGTLDGEWGGRSQAAFEAYARREFSEAPRNLHAALLVVKALDTLVNEGWDYRLIDWLAISALLPFDRLRLVSDRDGIEEWNHLDRALSLWLADYETAEVMRLHQSFLRDVPAGTDPYVLRRGNLWITAYPSGGGGRVYVRSDLLYGTWSTVIAEAGPDALNDLALITASLKPGPPPDVVPANDGRLLSLVEMLGDTLSRSAPSPEPEAQPAFPPPQPEGRPRGSGTAFFVNEDGIALTNSHVVSGCNSVTLDGQRAEILAESGIFDLAALRIDTEAETPALPFSPGPAALNADITIAGYPLSDILGGLNVGRGSVSSLKGAGGDETKIQISAPVQSGNSGGPVIDRFGNVVGVVVEKMNSLRGGEVVQNVNFAVRGEIAKAFLSSNGIRFSEEVAPEPLSPEDAANRLAEATRLVLCY